MLKPLALATAILLTLPTVALAQDTGGTAPLTLVEGDYAINAAGLADACTRPANIVVQGDASASLIIFDTVLNTNDAFAFWVSEDGDCSGTIPSGDNVLFGPESIEPDGSVVEFPTDFGGLFSQTDVFAALDDTACPNGSTPTVRRNLCVVVDSFLKSGGTGTGQGTIDASVEFYGWMTFEIDTQGPPAPDAPVVTELDSSLMVETSISATTSENDDIETYEIRYRAVPTPDDGLTCDDDTFSDEDDTEVDAVDDAVEATLDGLTNGTDYELCVRAVDDAGNAGPWSPLATGTPIDECDFIECFPGGAPIGYCGFGLSPAAALACLLCLAWRRRRRSR